jgi:hypothetical protein
VCGNGLAKYFDIEDRPRRITFVLSTEPLPESYLVSLRTIKVYGHPSDVIRLKHPESKRRYYVYNFYRSARQAIKDFCAEHHIKEFYVNVEA